MRCSAILALLFFAAASGAQPLTSDRPRFTETPLAVEAGRFQIELGTSYQEGGTSGDRVTAPEALVRLGVLPFAELRLGVPDYIRFEGENLFGAQPEGGWTDPSVGFKLEVGSPVGVNLSLLASATLPVRERTDRLGTLRANRWVPTLLFVAGTDLTDRVSLGAQSGITYNGPGGDDADLSGTIALGFLITEQVGTFAEVVVTDRTGVDASASVIVHSGATLLLTDDLQLDAHVGAGVTDTAPDVLVGVGASARF